MALKWPAALLLALGLLAADDPYAPLKAKCRELEQRIQGLDPELAPDVGIYLKAVQWALRFPEEFYSEEYLAYAEAALKRGLDRARELAAGQASWTTR